MQEANINQDDEYEKLKSSKFKQQKLPAWRPVPTITSTTIIFLAFGIIFIIIGIIVLIYSGKIVEISQQYDEICTLHDTCNVHFDIKDKMKQPIMVYYQIDNFYQNHRRYVKSRSDQQLNGKYQSLKALQDSGDCDPVVTNRDMGKNESVSHEYLEPDDVAIPCGLIAKSMFNDTFKLFKGNDTLNPEKEITINSTNIAWKADKKLKYKNTENPPGGKNWTQVQWIDMKDEHFIVWMRLAGLPNFRKLYGRIKEDLQGQYFFSVENEFEVGAFGGKKYIVISTVNAFGGKNTFLGVTYIVVGAVCILLAAIFLIGYQIRNRKEK